MTISTESNKITYQGNGATTQWSFDFLIPVASDLDLIKTLIADSSTETIPPSAYTVAGLGDPDGGLVTYPLTGPPLSAAYNLTILRILPLTQETDLTNQGSFNAESVEDEFDTLVMQIQQVQEQVDRALMFPVGSTSDDESIADLMEAILNGAANAASAAASAAAAAQSAEDAAAERVGLAVTLNFNATAGGNPPSATFRADDSTVDEVTTLYLSKTDLDGNDIGAFLHAMDDSTSTRKAILNIVPTEALDKRLSYSVIGEVEDFPTFVAFPVTFIGPPAGTFPAGGARCVMTFLLTGDASGDVPNWVDRRFIGGALKTAALDCSFRTTGGAERFWVKGERTQAEVLTYTRDGDAWVPNQTYVWSKKTADQPTRCPLGLLMETIHTNELLAARDMRVQYVVHAGGGSGTFGEGEPVTFGTGPKTGNVSASCSDPARTALYNVSAAPVIGDIITGASGTRLAATAVPPAWVHVNCGVFGAGVTKVTGIDDVASSASKIVPTGDNWSVTQAASFAADFKVYSAWIKRPAASLTWTGTVGMTVDGVTKTDLPSLSTLAYIVKALPRVEAMTSGTFGIMGTKSTDQIEVDFNQVESDFVSTPIESKWLNEVRRTMAAYCPIQLGDIVESVTSFTVIVDWFNWIGDFNGGNVLSFDEPGTIIPPMPDPMTGGRMTMNFSAGNSNSRNNMGTTFQTPLEIFGVDPHSGIGTLNYTGLTAPFVVGEEVEGQTSKCTFTIREIIPSSGTAGQFVVGDVRFGDGGLPPATLPDLDPIFPIESGEVLEGKTSGGAAIADGVVIGATPTKATQSNFPTANRMHRHVVSWKKDVGGGQTLVRCAGDSSAVHVNDSQTSDELPDSLANIRWGSLWTSPSNPGTPINGGLARVRIFDGFATEAEVEAMAVL